MKFFLTFFWWYFLLLLSSVLVNTVAVTAASQDDSSSSSSSCEATTETETDTTTTATTTKTSLIKMRIGLEWFLNPDHLPLLVAQEQGYFAARGLDVELVAPEHHWHAEQEILAGRLDVALTEPLHLAQDAAAGKPVLGFGRFFHTDGGVMYRTEDDNDNGGSITRPADMCGKTISYPGAPGPGGPAIVQTMVQADGKHDCPLDSYGTYNGGFFHVNALQERQADLATLIFWNFEIPQATAQGLPVSFFSLKDWGVPDFCQLVLFTTPDRFAQDPSLFRRLVLALRQATGYIHQYPEAAKDIYRQHVVVHDNGTVDERQVLLLEATLNATLPAFPNDAMMAMEYYHRLMQWLVDTHQVDETAAAQTRPETYWTNAVAW